MGAVGCLGRVGQQLVDLAGNVAFQTADDLPAVFAFRLPSLDVFDGWLVPAHPGGGDTPQGCFYDLQIGDFGVGVLFGGFRGFGVLVVGFRVVGRGGGRCTV